MVNRILRNVDMADLLIRELPVRIAAIHKETAKEFTATRGPKGDYSVFAFRKYQKPRKYESIDAIPVSALVLPASIGITGRTGENFAVEIATEFVRLFFQMAPVRTQTYKNSIRLTLNGRMRALSSLRKIQQSNPLKQGEIIEVFSAVEYASTLEAPNYNVEGIFLKITKQLLASWGDKAAIRFTYRSGQKLGMAFKYMTPVVMIGARGEFASSVTTRRGYQLRRRNRQLKKANKSRKAAGQRPLKALPRSRSNG